ncbi:MAG TPA: hypothetical protein VMD04_00970, partial [Candidatus Margulisiibacteriota bacterium]|nr:hypothetical protein [Candidatus Margulisiibacteriota bacterium]
REMLEYIKIEDEYFDEDFFLLLEDFDIAWRGRRCGWRAAFFPQLVCYHHGGISRNRTALSQYYTFRNRYLLLIKNGEITEILRVLILFPFYEIPRLIFLLFSNKKTKQALKEIKALFPKMLKKRMIIRTQARIKPGRGPGLCG